MNEQQWPMQSQPNEMFVHRNSDELRGRFSDTFTVLYNGDNFVIEFFTRVPRQDGKMEQTLVSRMFMTEKGLVALAQGIQKVVDQIKQKGVKQIPPAKNKP